MRAYTSLHYKTYKATYEYIPAKGTDFVYDLNQVLVIRVRFKQFILVYLRILHPLFHPVHNSFNILLHIAGVVVIQLLHNGRVVRLHRFFYNDLEDFTFDVLANFEVTVAPRWRENNYPSGTEVKICIINTGYSWGNFGSQLSFFRHKEGKEEGCMLA